MRSRIEKLRHAPVLEKVAFGCLCTAWLLMIVVISFLDIWVVGKVSNIGEDIQIKSTVEF